MRLANVYLLLLVTSASIVSPNNTVIARSGKISPEQYHPRQRGQSRQPNDAVAG
jgi:hypothetical protein